MTIDTKSDFKDLATMGVPVKRAAYSDRTAWIMAILAELAYIPFDEESEQTILSAQAVVKRGGGAGRTSVSQSWKVTGHFVRPGAQAEGTIGELIRKMARPAGFEPATLGLVGLCAIQLSYGRRWHSHERRRQTSAFERVTDGVRSPRRQVGPTAVRCQRVAEERQLLLRSSGPCR